MSVREAHNRDAWDDFLQSQPYRPFLQSWTMGEVYRQLGQEPIRLEIKDGDHTLGICFGHVVAARRGRHLAIPYGPVMSDQRSEISDQLNPLVNELQRIAKEKNCTFIRMSPFWPCTPHSTFHIPHSLDAPLHLLAEHLWYLPLRSPDPWMNPLANPSINRTEEEIFQNFRATHRNLIRRAEKEGVTVEASTNPLRDLPLFLALHEETRKRHHFTPYTDAFFCAQVEHFAARDECTLYLARYGGSAIAASIHMHAFGETSYHHGASAHAHSKIPASYLLQWTAIRDALKRGDHVYNFWGIAPPDSKRHPFVGVMLFKTGFGGSLLNLIHCRDIPLSSAYRVTRAIETLRKWKRGF